MRPEFTLLVCSCVVCASGCTQKDVDLLISQNDTYAEAFAKAEAFGNETIVPVFENEGTTQFADLPVSGEATHNGYIGGFENGADETPINYVANLELTYAFGSSALSGRAFDYVTDVDGFETPDGEMMLAGGIVNAGGDAALFFNGGAVLTGESVSAEFNTTAEGVFGGSDGRVAGGDHSTDVDWLSGAPSLGDGGTSDGLWGVAN